MFVFVELITRSVDENAYCLQVGLLYLKKPLNISCLICFVLVFQQRFCSLSCRPNHVVAIISPFPSSGLFPNTSQIFCPVLRDLAVKQVNVARRLLVVSANGAKAIPAEQFLLVLNGFIFSLVSPQTPATT